MRRRAFVVGSLALVTIGPACSGSDDDGELDAIADSGAGGRTGEGVRVVDVGAAAELLESRSDAGRVILDVRTPEEFAEGHLEDAELLDFYRADFADQIAELDRDTPYLVYCRSGNRSGQARAIMQELGFTDVADLDGGVIAWEADGRDFVVP